MPTARASRTIAAPVQELWELIRDPHHLPRWWPRVTRVEGVEESAFTEVMLTKKGKVVRADFSVARVDESAHVLTWAQRIEGTPFAAVLRSAETELRLQPASAPGAQVAAAAFGEDAGPAPAAGATEVTIELRQELGASSAGSGPYVNRLPRSFLPRLGSWLVRRAAKATVEQALDGLEQISG